MLCVSVGFCIVVVVWFDGDWVGGGVVWLAVVVGCIVGVCAVSVLFVC